MCINRIGSPIFHDGIFYSLNNSLDNPVDKYTPNLRLQSFKCTDRRNLWYTKKDVRPLTHILNKLALSNNLWAQNNRSWEYHQSNIYCTPSNYILLYYLSIFEHLVRISSYDLRKNISKAKLQQMDMSQVYMNMFLCLDCFRKTRDPNFMRLAYEGLSKGLNPDNCVKIRDSVVKEYWRFYELLLHKIHQYNSDNYFSRLFSDWETQNSPTDTASSDKNSTIGEDSTIEDRSVDSIKKGKCRRPTHSYLDFSQCSNFVTTKNRNM
ncbi:hypothetical protein BMR1_03g01925 [Babesia microti strain RI]|uniref:Uncharacterized protein n=1 Tax=Babesia microti (strain RI) TaxID=1133968 RepID=A0A0K3AMQ0_BABMR|nr:hypothetical protein BMR1_03g01925 [Babesia microti strain RI]CTQ40984.1 hypothetical protein BMR1_03g01925 [Babesia microti strain RI]|eukprot:XP_021337222.1 hypothetical protein BMR1_03g01925 [Babesia microti strain RI]